jgi:phosphate-selective porin OprO and OprP
MKKYLLLLVCVLVRNAYPQNNSNPPIPADSFAVDALRPIRLSTFIHIRYQQSDEPGKTNGFDLRRALVDLKGNITKYFNYNLLVDLSNGPKIVDAYAEIPLNQYLNFTIGQFKIPLSYESNLALNTLDVVDYSQVINALAARGSDVIGNQSGRDIGIMAGGSLIKLANRSLIEYNLGLFNGSGVNIADTSNDAKDVAGHFTLHPTKNFSIGTSFYNGWGKAVQPDSAYTGKSQVRNRFGIDVSYTTSAFSMRGEYLQGKDANINKAGWYVLAEYYLIPDKLQALVKYDVYDPDKAIDDNTIIDYVAGLNILFNKWSSVQAFYTFQKNQASDTGRNYLTLQLRIGF